MLKLYTKCSACSLQFTLECRPFNEDHNAENIQRVLSEQVTAIPGKVEGQRVTAVTDSAANMVRSVADTEGIDFHVRCIAHVINNAAEAGFKGTLAPCIKRCKALASDTHKSSKACTLIRKACEENNIAYVKIIQPVKTRWHSMAMTMHSVFRLKRALLSIKSKGDRDNKNVTTLVKHMPTKVQFDAMEALVPDLKQIQVYSERLTSEKRPTIHLVIAILVSLHRLTSTNPMANNFLTLFKAYLASRVPNCGRNDQNWAMASFLHPKYKGALLFYETAPDGPLLGDIEEVTRKTVCELVQFDKQRVEEEDHHDDLEEELGAAAATSTPVEAGTSTATLDRTMTDSQWASVEDYLESANLVTYGNPLEESRPMNTISAQIETYLNKLPKMGGNDGDVLAYWKTHADTVPDLARFARSILCIPASSASSERMFSLAGRTITTQRTSISSARAEQLIYINQNYERAIPHIKTWDLGIVDPHAGAGKKGKGKGKKSKDGPPVPDKDELAAAEEAAEDADLNDPEWNVSDIEPDTTDDESLVEEVDLTE